MIKKYRTAQLVADMNSQYMGNAKGVVAIQSVVLVAKKVGYALYIRDVWGVG